MYTTDCHHWNDGWQGRLFMLTALLHRPIEDPSCDLSVQILKSNWQQKFTVTLEPRINNMYTQSSGGLFGPLLANVAEVLRPQRGLRSPLSIQSYSPHVYLITNDLMVLVRRKPPLFHRLSLEIHVCAHVSISTTIGAMARTSAQPQFQMSLLRSFFFKKIDHCSLVGWPHPPALYCVFWPFLYLWF